MCRPKKDPAERLSIKCMMHEIIAIKMLAHSGYALEQFFEPELGENRRYNGQIYDSSKWRRYLRDGKMPGEKSLKLIKEKVPYAIKYLSSPFWEAISHDRKNENDWIKFYSKLDFHVKSYTYEFLANPIDYEEIKVSKHPLYNLIRIGSDHAVAALIGLLRQFDDKLCVRPTVETSLYNIIFNFLSRFCPKSFLPELYAYLYQNILMPTQKVYYTPPWPESIGEVQEMIWIEHKNLLLAEDLGILDKFTSHAEFFYWKLRGDRHRIIREMVFMLDVPCFGPEAPPTKKGLRWLVKKLNKDRPEDHKLSTIFF